MKRILLCFFILIVPALQGMAQEAPQVLTLAASIDKALANSDEARLLDNNLDLSRTQHALNIAKNSFTVGSSIGYGQGVNLGDTSLASSGSRSGSSGSGTLNGAQAGLNLIGPLTTLSLTAIPYTPPSLIFPYEPASGGSGNTPNNTSTLGLSFSQTLWNGYPGGAGQATVDKSAFTLQSKVLGTDSGRLNLIYGIKQNYYTMLTAQRNLALRQVLLEKQQTVFKQITAIYELKQASSVDLQSAAINVKSAEIDLKSAAKDLQLARLRLANQIGLPADNAFTVDEAPDPEIRVSSLDEALAQGLDNRVELKQLEFSRKSAEIDLSLARGLSTPTLSVGGGLNWLFDWSGKNTATGNVYVKLSMPILDANAANLQVQASQEQLSLYSLQKNQLQKAISVDIRDAYETWQLSLSKLELAKMSTENVQKQFELTKVRVEHQTAPNQDLMDAAVNAANAEAALAKARSDVQLAILKLQNVMGN